MVWREWGSDGGLTPRLHCHYGWVFFGKALFMGVNTFIRTPHPLKLGIPLPSVALSHSPQFSVTVIPLWLVVTYRPFSFFREWKNWGIFVSNTQQTIRVPKSDALMEFLLTPEPNREP